MIQTNHSKSVARSIVRWFQNNARDLPWRRTRDPYGIWISEVMLQQTQVKTVIPYWERWMQLFPDVHSLANAPEEQLLRAWEGLGYYTRARNLQRAARIVSSEYRGEFPRGFDQVLGLPGIGRYTAGAICSIAFGQPAPILDGNVARVLSRLFVITGDPREAETKEQLWKIAAQLVLAASGKKRNEKDGQCSELNQGLMELGATICTPREPQCLICPVRPACGAFAAGRMNELPRKTVRPKPNVRLFHAYIFRKGAKVLVRRRAADVVNGGLWEFPNQEINQDASCESPEVVLKPFSTIRHTITNNRITLKAFDGMAGSKSSGARLARQFDAEWRDVSALNELPFSSAHAKLRALLQQPG
jgi:A/G-specific adenine glycosylase